MNDTTAMHLDALADLGPEFDDHEDIGWCLIKWPDDTREHEDLDVLVSSGLDAACEIVEDHGYWYEHDKDPFRRKYVQNDVEVDIHTEAAWVGIRYLTAEWITKTANISIRGTVEVPVPSPNADYLIWAAHDTRSNQIPERDIRYCRQLLGQVDPYACACIAASHGWMRSFFAFHDRVLSGEFGPFSTWESMKLKAALVAPTRWCHRYVWMHRGWAIAKFDLPYLLK